MVALFVARRLVTELSTGLRLKYSKSASATTVRRISSPLEYASTASKLLLQGYPLQGDDKTMCDFSMQVGRFPVYHVSKGDKWVQIRSIHSYNISDDSLV